MDTAEFKRGMQVEQEHMATYQWLAQYVKKYSKLPLPTKCSRTSYTTTSARTQTTTRSWRLLKLTEHPDFLARVSGLVDQGNMQEGLEVYRLA